MPRPASSSCTGPRASTSTRTRPYDKAGTPNSTYSKVMYATTRDFVTFSPAKVWQDAGDRIDSTVHRGRRHVLPVHQGGHGLHRHPAGVLDRRSARSRCPGDYAWSTDASCISKTARSTTRTTEGPTIFRANAGDTSLPAGADEGFYLFVDDFTGAGYLPLFTESLAAPQWQHRDGRAAEVAARQRAARDPQPVGGREGRRRSRRSRPRSSSTGVAAGDALLAPATC